MSDMNEDTDWFGGTKGVREIPEELERQALAISDGAGFTLRQPLREPPKRRRGTSKQLHNFTMRLAVDDMEVFIRHCEDNRLSYREAFGAMVAELKKQGQAQEAA